MRAFIGIDFSDQNKKKIIQIQEIVKSHSIRGRWKYIDNFHLTLKFMGEVSENQTKLIHENMENRLKGFSSFNFNAGGLGYFKGKESLRVVYIKIADQEMMLQELFKISDDCCSLAGIAKEQRLYTPHITIAQDVTLKGDFKALESEAAKEGDLSISVGEVFIIKSEQIGNKRVYTNVNCIKLKG